MFNALFRLGAMLVAGRWLKHRWKGLLVLIAFLLAVRLLHGEYVQYVRLSGDTSWLWQSSLVKLGLYILAVAAYLFLVERRLIVSARPPRADAPPTRNAHDREDTNTTPQQLPVPVKGDGFDFLRSKSKLQGSAEKLLRK